MIKMRLTQPFLLLIMVILVIIYCIALLLFWPIYLIGSFVWSDKILIHMNNFYYNNIPNINNNDSK